MMLDVFKGDAFHWTQLTQSVNKLPYVPTRIRDMGLFRSRGVNTLTVAIELRNGKLSLVQSRPRGASGDVKDVEKRVIKDFRPVHLPQRVKVLADEVQGLRPFGQEDGTVAPMQMLMDRFAVAKQDIELTHEFHRLGALKGQLLDADGTTVIYDFHSEFGLTPNTYSIALGSAGTKMRGEVVEIKRRVENKLGGVMASGIHFLCGRDWLDAFVDHDDVREELRQDRSDVNRADVRERFIYAGCVFEEYRGSVGGIEFVAPDKAHAVPLGVPGLFETYFAPANYMETVNTLGLPLYVKPKTMDFDTGVEWDVQSNPLHICTQPDACVTVSMT